MSGIIKIELKYIDPEWEVAFYNLILQVLHGSTPLTPEGNLELIIFSQLKIQLELLNENDKTSREKII